MFFLFLNMLFCWLLLFTFFDYLLVPFDDIVDIAHMLLIVAWLFFSLLSSFLYLPHHKARLHRPLRHNQVLQLLLLEGVVHKQGLLIFLGSSNLARSGWLR